MVKTVQTIAAEFHARVPDGGIGDRRGAFLVTMNEERREETLKTLCKERCPNGSITIGAAGEFNLDILAATKASGALFLAPDTDQQLLWKKAVFPIIGQRSARGKYLDEMYDYMHAHVHSGVKLAAHAGDNVFFNAGAGQLAEMEARKKGEGAAWHWTSTDEGYDHVRGRLLEGEIAWVQYNLIVPGHGEILGDIIQEAERVPYAVYGSNVAGHYHSNLNLLGYSQGFLGDSVDGDATKLYQQNVEALLRHAPEAMIVESSVSGGGACRHDLHVVTPAAHAESMAAIRKVAEQRFNKSQTL